MSVRYGKTVPPVEPAGEPVLMPIGDEWWPVHVGDVSLECAHDSRVEVTLRGVVDKDATAQPPPLNGADWTDGEITAALVQPSHEVAGDDFCGPWLLPALKRLWRWWNHDQILSGLGSLLSKACKVT